MAIPTAIDVMWSIQVLWINASTDAQHSWLTEAKTLEETCQLKSTNNALGILYV